MYFYSYELVFEIDTFDSGRLIKRSILSSRLLEGVVCRLVKNTLDLSIGICFKLVVENVKSIVKTAMFDFPGRLFVSYIYCKNKEKS